MACRLHIQPEHVIALGGRMVERLHLGEAEALLARAAVIEGRTP